MILVVLGLGVIVTHPASSLFVCLALVILGLYGRSVAVKLLVLMVISAVAWLAIVANPIFADSGLTAAAELFGNALSDSGADGEVTLSSERQLVIRIRQYLLFVTALIVAATAVAMSSERFRHLRPAVPLIPLVAVSPITLLVSRFSWPTVAEAFTFSLPVAAVVFGRLLAGLRFRELSIVTALTAALLSPLFLLARYGDDSFEKTTATDRSAIETGYAEANGATLFVADSSYVAWRDRAVHDNTFVIAPAVADRSWLNSIRGSADQAGANHIIVILTESQRAWRVHGLDQSPDVLDEFAAWLVSQPETRVLFRDGSSWAIEVQP